MIAITIETKDRRLNGGENYLGQTIRNLRRATNEFDDGGVCSIDIVCNGIAGKDFELREVWEPLNGFEARFHLKDGTRQQNGARAIRVGAAQPYAEWVLKLEDDLDFCDDFIGSVSRWLAKYGHAAVPMFSLGGHVRHGQLLAVYARRDAAPGRPVVPLRARGARARAGDPLAPCPRVLGCAGAPLAPG
jgi:hypothetical protein